MSSKQDSGHGPVMMVFVDDFACTARLVDLPTSDRAGAASHTKAFSESKREVMFSSQVLLSAGDNDYGISFPLGDESNRIEELATYLSDNDNELKHFGLFEILQLLNESAGESDEGVVELYFTLLIKTCLELLAGKTWIRRLAICVPWLKQDHEDSLNGIFRQLKNVFELDELRHIDTYRCLLEGSEPVNNDQRNKIACFAVWRRQLTGVVWQYYAQPRDWKIAKSQADPNANDDCPIIEIAFTGMPANDLSKIFRIGALLGLARTHNTSYESSFACCRLSQSRPVAFVGQAGIPEAQRSVLPNINFELIAENHDRHCNGHTYSYFVIEGTLLFSEIFKRDVTEKLGALLSNPGAPPQKCSMNDRVFKGMKAVLKMNANHTKRATKKCVSVQCNDRDAIEYKSILGSAIELKSPLKNEIQSDEVLKFSITNNEHEKHCLQLPLDAFDNDDRYLLEPSEGEDGSVQLLMRVGTRPVALQVAEEKPEGGVALNLLSGGMYEVTFSDEERAELTLQKRLLRFVQSGTSIFGRNCNAQEV